MATTDTPTLDQVLTLATRLPPADKLRLIERLVPQVTNMLPTEESQPPASTSTGNPQAIIAALQHTGQWEGGDFEERLGDVIASREQVQFDT